jgi:hypothetical protein
MEHKRRMANGLCKHSRHVKSFEIGAGKMASECIMSITTIAIIGCHSLKQKITLASSQ